MTQITRGEIDTAVAAWQNRMAQPEVAANAIRDLAARYAVEPSAIADVINASAAEVLVFIQFADLEQPLKAAFLKKGFLPALMARVVELEPEAQAVYLNEIFKSPEPLAAARRLESDARERELSWMSSLTGPQLMHLSKKAGGYEAFSDKNRRALLNFGQLLRSRLPLSVPQQQYLRAMLTELDEKGVLLGGCFEPDCRTCAAIQITRKSSA